jgi:hypothetical protein
VNKANLHQGYLKNLTVRTPKLDEAAHNSVDTGEFFPRFPLTLAADFVASNKLADNPPATVESNYLAE